MFPEATFGEPCSDEQIAQAETRLGHPLPPVLVELYRAFDGFVGPTNAQFLYPLCNAPRDMIASLVEHTLFLRGEDYFPDFLKAAVAVGDMGTGTCWLILLEDPTRVVQWEGSWGDDYEVLEGGLTDAWLSAKQLYDSASGGE
jgi:hypothetical protein